MAYAMGIPVKGNYRDESGIWVTITISPAQLKNMMLSGDFVYRIEPQ